jgi:hypothetical protein
MICQSVIYWEQEDSAQIMLADVAPKYDWIIQQWVEHELLDDGVALNRVMFVASDGQPGCPLTNRNNELPYFSRP